MIENIVQKNSKLLLLNWYTEYHVIQGLSLLNSSIIQARVQSQVLVPN